MRFEHFGINVSEPQAMARWYVEHLGFQIVRAQLTGAQTHFLADESGRVVIEIYNNPSQPVPDYRNQHPLLFHFAMEAADAEAEKARLLAAGAEFFEEVRPDERSLLVMLRDPWGMPLQLCMRSQPMPTRG